MRVLPVQSKVLPRLVKSAKSLPKEVLAAGGAVSASAVAAKTIFSKELGPIVASDGSEYCGSIEQGWYP